MSTFRRLIPFVVVLFAALYGAARAQERALDRESLDKAIHDYIMRHPEVIRAALEKAELNEQIERTKRVLRENSDALYRGEAVVIGAANAKVTIVEFFDYNCPYCRRIHPTLLKFVADNPDVRLIQHDAAMLGKESEAVARIAIAARRTGKIEALHDALMRRPGRITEADALDVARKLGLDADRLRKEAASPEVAKALVTAKDLAQRLSVDGTPLFIVGHDGIPGTPDDWLQRLQKLVEKVRGSGCEVCAAGGRQNQ